MDRFIWICTVYKRYLSVYIGMKGLNEHGKLFFFIKGKQNATINIYQLRCKILENPSILMQIKSKPDEQ